MACSPGCPDLLAARSRSPLLPTPPAAGYCCSNRCFNMAHAWQLGWVAPQLLNGTTLAPGQTRNISTKALTRTSNSGLKIDITWVQGQASLFLGYRLAEGPDGGLDTAFAGKVGVHSYAGTSNHSPDFSYLLGQMGPGESMTHSTSGLVLKVWSTNAATGTASLWVCRKSASGQETLATCDAGYDGDCDGLSGAADPDCTPFLPAVGQIK